MKFVIILVIVLVVLAVIYVACVYNKLIGSRNKVDNQFSQVDIQLKKRTDLIPNLIEIVKGYAKHEKDVLKDVIEARNKVTNANNINEKVEANNELGTTLTKLFALSEAYPDLKANTNFVALQKDFKDVEDKIAYSRQFYNDSAMEYNNIVEMFPSNIVANIFRFKKYEFFKINQEEKEIPKVKFD